MKVLDLFSGIGGFSLGLHRAGMSTVAFCEIEPYPQAVLRKNFPGVPIYDDVRTVTAERLRADGIDTIDLICGGFPCQPFSVAGKQRGKKDDRHLWPEMFRIISEVRPTWVIGENVAGFISMALCEVSADLESIGYEVQPFVIPACAAGADHRRDRCWIMAHAASGDDRRIPGKIQGKNEQQAAKRPEERVCTFIDASSSNGANPDQTGLPKREGVETSGQGAVCWHEFVGSYGWSIEPSMGRVAHGIPRRVDRIKGLGNAVVPEIPEIIGRAIMAVEVMAV